VRSRTGPRAEPPAGHRSRRRNRAPGRPGGAAVTVGLFPISGHPRRYKKGGQKGRRKSELGQYKAGAIATAGRRRGRSVRLIVVMMTGKRQATIDTRAELCDPDRHISACRKRQRYKRRKVRGIAGRFQDARPRPRQVSIIKYKKLAEIKAGNQPRGGCAGAFAGHADESVGLWRVRTDSAQPLSGREVENEELPVPSASSSR